MAAVVLVPHLTVYRSWLKSDFRLGGGEHVEARDNMTPLSRQPKLKPQQETILPENLSFFLFLPMLSSL